VRLGLFITAITALGLTVTGCGGSTADNGPKDVATPAGLSLSVLQYRSDYTIRQIEIKVTNAGSEPVRVSAARLSSTAFSGGAAWLSRNQADDAIIRPRTSTDLTAALPPSTCATSSSSFQTTARLDLRSADGSSARTASLPVGDPYASIARVHTEDCRREAALKIADLELVDPLRTSTRGGHLIGLLDLRLTPSGKPGTLTVESISSTTLLGPPTGAAWQIGRSVSAASGPQTVTLELRAARCDPHAIAEDKLGTVLPVTLHVDDGESGVVTVPANPDLRKQIQDFVHTACTGG
jgi:hypothetical protein